MLPYPDDYGTNVSALACGPLLFQEMRYAFQGGRSFHSHEEAQLIFFLSGTVKEDRKRETFIRKPSMLILIPAEEPHATHFLDGVRTFEIALPTSWLERIRQVSDFTERAADYEQGVPIQLATRLYREFQCRDNLTPLILEGLTLELLVEIGRSAIRTADSAIPRWLKQVQDFLQAQFAENLSLETLASVVGVHPSHLTRVFRQHFHCTIGDYVRDLRMEQARHTLSTSDTPLGEIALALGYSDQSHFTTAFKRHTGISSGKYRKICRVR